MAKNYLSNRCITIYLANIIDHCELALYAFLVPTFMVVFLPQQNSLHQVLIGYGIFTISLLARPLGAYYFAKKANSMPMYFLGITLFGVSLATLLMAILPAYSSFGLFAVVFLALFKALQNFFAAGEVSIAEMYILNVTQNQHHSLTSGFYNASKSFGTFIGCIGAAIVSLSYHPEYFWRYSFFIIGAIGIGVSLWRFFFIKEADNYKELIPLDFKSLFYSKSSIKKITMLSLLKGTNHMNYYISMVLFVALVPLINKNIQLSTTLTFSAITIGYSSVIMAVFGKLLEKKPYKLLIKYLLILFVIYMPIVMICLKYLNLAQLIIVQLFMLTIGALMISPMQRFSYNFLQDNERFQINAISFCIGSDFIGRTTPFIGLLIYKLTKEPIITGIYASLVGMCTLYGYLYWTKDKRNLPMSEGV